MVEIYNVDVIGMSGLFVKLTVVMKENLFELNVWGLGMKWLVLFGGVVFICIFVEDDLVLLFDGEVCYVCDVFEGLVLMELFVVIVCGVDVVFVGLFFFKKCIYVCIIFEVTESEDMFV